VVLANTDKGKFDMQTFHSVSDVARRLGASPREISDLFYGRELRDDLCPILAGRRLIPESYIPEIERALRRHGRLPSALSRKEVP
jgi:hypothetical protein